MNLTAVIPVRENPSGRLPQKCLLPFRDGMNLTEWKIRQMLTVLPPARIYLSTNSPALMRAADKFGVNIHNRIAYLCDGDRATWPEVVTGIVQDIPGEHIAIVHVTNPLTEPADYRAAFRAYTREVISGPHDSLITVNRLNDFLWNDHGPVNYQADRRHSFSQDLPPLYRLTCALYMAPKASILEWGYPIGPNPYKVPCSKRAGVDIDTAEDYKIALAL